jgi:hypothetical protein
LELNAQKTACAAGERLVVIVWVAKEFFNPVNLDTKLFGHVKRVAIVLFSQFAQLIVRNLPEFFK